MFSFVKKFWQKKDDYFKKSETTYFYWELKNGKQTGRLLKTKDASKISKVQVVPQKSSNELSLANCIMFSVAYDWYNREIWMSYYFPKYENLRNKEKSYVENLSDIEMDSRVKVLWIMEGDSANLVQSEYQSEISTDFGDDLPEPVIKHAIKEIERMQTGAFGYSRNRVSPDTKSHKTYNNELLLAYLTSPFNSY